MSVTIYHKIQPDYEKRMELMKKHVLYWVQEGVSIPMNLAPVPLQDESERAQVRIRVRKER